MVTKSTGGRWCHRPPGGGHFFFPPPTGPPPPVDVHRGPVDPPSRAPEKLLIHRGGSLSSVRGPFTVIQVLKLRSFSRSIQPRVLQQS